MGERVVEGVEGPLAADREGQRLLGLGLPNLDARAVVVGAPVERDLDAAADPAGELMARIADCCGRHLSAPPPTAASPPGRRRARSAGARQANCPPSQARQLQPPPPDAAGRPSRSGKP